LDLPRPELLRIVPSHNGEECAALLKEIRPDVIAVYATAIIRPHIFELAGQCALNLHTGICPRYRGTDAVFWPLHNEEPEWVGVTVHVLDEGVDSGPIIFTGRPRIDVDDDEDSLFAKCTVVGADLYAKAIDQAATGRIRSTPQDLSEGRQYRLVDRNLFAERRVERLLDRGLLSRFARE
jgi:methionyl-tRNA formyltransferase